MVTHLVSCRAVPEWYLQDFRIHPSRPLRGRCLRQETEGGELPFGNGNATGFLERRIPPSVRMGGHLPRKGGEGSKFPGSGVFYPERFSVFPVGEDR